MQNTRLNNLFDTIADRLGRTFRNPWRRVSLVLVCLLFGVFLGTAIPTTAGQTSNWDVLTAGVLIIFTETVSRFTYSRRRGESAKGSPQRSLLADMVNSLKIGLTYSMFLEAFKLGS
ncbi:MAG: DUF565 domain-containing protein [Kastovskya adunca ATA6-11-RM4]|jgi:hypothetical protein|nr:DUF565 domain-containing protein [Kastovskya adunca ATA6-11-RM4]